jgi:hypothetical protein
MKQAELAGRTARLPELFADRVPASDLAGLRSMAGAGEWDELLDLLVAALRVTRAPVSVDEFDELRSLLNGWGMPTGQLDGLIVRSGS